ncbi:MAG: alpha-amylase [Bacteroidales bacterium]|nr:alpha-amylase [Bacteroidales bacterium]
MKKYLKVLIILIASAAFFSCKEPLPETTSATMLKADKTMVKFSAKAGNETISLTTDAQSWTASADAEWITIDPASGSGDAQVTVSVPANQSSRRSSTVTFSAEGLKDVVVTVIQEEGERPEDKTGVFSDPETPDADSPCTLYFRPERGSSLYGETELYAHIGINEWANVQADWGQNTDKCKFQPTEESNLFKLEISPSIREWFGSKESEVFRIAVVVRNADGSAQTSDLFLAVKDNRNAFVPDPVVEEALPTGAKHGINYNSDGSVTFVFYEKNKNGEHYDWCYLIGEFNGWERRSDYAMKRDNEAGCWWITCTGFESGKEYMFQYMTGDDEARLRLSDPYSEITYSSDDQWIASGTYPGLRAYPSQTSGYVSAFEIGKEAYNWQVTDYEIEDQNDLIIYELLLRDFTENGGKEGNLELAMEKLDYLETLGVNAIELMPVQEFDGNDSWGYNPNHYFAMDKAYGTREMYKAFIDECHKRGIAVLIDVVYNHLTGNNAFDKMYPLTINPFFNIEAPHPYSVFEDINHDNEVIATYIKRSLGYLLTEYKVDGFRFDLTKGFTNNKSTESTASNYDASRVAILKGYNDYIRSVKDDAVVILEHFCDDKEEKELGEAGMKVWRNINWAYGQAAQGYKSESGFQGLYTGSTGMTFGGYVGFMESHDEERNAYRQKSYGADGIKGNIAAMMQRLELNAAFFLTVPGPKMIWQFGELGYDTSIEDGGRTGKKAPKWDYYDVPERKALYDTYCDLIGFRRNNPEFFDESASFSWKVTASDWDNGRFITCTAGSKSFVVIGNFTTEEKTLTAEMPATGTWKNYFDPAEVYEGSNISLTLPSGEFRLLVNF